MATIHSTGRHSPLLSPVKRFLAQLSLEEISLRGAGVAYVTVFVLSSLLLFTGTASASTAPLSIVDLATAGDFVILAKSGISTTGTTSITGNIGVSPIGSTAITGFGLIMDPSNQFATSALLNGKAYAANSAAPTPAIMTAAISDMQTAYADAAARTNPTATELGAGNIGGMTLAPGLYKWGTDVSIPTDVTLSGGANDVWIFQIAGTLTLSSAKRVLLSGGAQAKNIFWQVAGQTTLGTTSVFNGNILDQTAIVLTTGATLNGRALAQTAVTLDSNNVVKVAASTAPVVVPVATPPPPVVIPVNPNRGNTGGGSASQSSASSSSQTTITPPVASGRSMPTKPTITTLRRIEICYLQRRTPHFTPRSLPRLAHRLALRWSWTTDQVQVNLVDRSLCQ